MSIPVVKSSTPQPRSVSPVPSSTENTQPQATTLPQAQKTTQTARTVASDGGSRDDNAAIQTQTQATPMSLFDIYAALEKQKLMDEKQAEEAKKAERKAAADAIDIDADSNAETLSAQNIPPIKSSVPPSTNIVKPKVESYIRAEKGLHRSKFSNVASTATPAPKPTINSQGETSTSTASMPSSLAKSPGIQATTTGAQTIDLTEIDDSPQKQHKPGPTTHTNTHTNTHAHTQTNTTKNKNAHYPHPVFGDDGVESGEGPAPIHKRLNVAEANKSTGSYMGQTGVTGALDPMGEDDIDEDEPMRTTGINKAPMGISNESVIERSEDSGSGSEGASDDEEVDTGMAVDGTDSENEALLDQTDRQPSQGIESENESDEESSEESAEDDDKDEDDEDEDEAEEENLDDAGIARTYAKNSDIDVVPEKLSTVVKIDPNAPVGSVFMYKTAALKLQGIQSYKNNRVNNQHDASMPSEGTLKCAVCLLEGVNAVPFWEFRTAEGEGPVGEGYRHWERRVDHAMQIHVPKPPPPQSDSEPKSQMSGSQTQPQTQDVQAQTTVKQEPMSMGNIADTPGRASATDTQSQTSTTTGETRTVGRSETNLQSSVNATIKSEPKPASTPSTRPLSHEKGELGVRGVAVVQCCDCRVAVHVTCYGIQSIDNPSEWRCSLCATLEYQQGDKLAVNCELCPQQGGAFMSAGKNKWVHTACALFIYESYFQGWRDGVGFPSRRPVLKEPIMLDKIPASRKSLKCKICAQSMGTAAGKKKVAKTACKQCDYGQCVVAFHVTCVQRSPDYPTEFDWSQFPSYNALSTYCTNVKHPPQKMLARYLKRKKQSSKFSEGPAVSFAPGTVSPRNRGRQRKLIKALNQRDGVGSLDSVGDSHLKVGGPCMSLFKPNKLWYPGKVVSMRVVDILNIVIYDDDDTALHRDVPIQKHMCRPLKPGDEMTSGTDVMVKKGDGTDNEQKALVVSTKQIHWAKCEYEDDSDVVEQKVGKEIVSMHTWKHHRPMGAVEADSDDDFIEPKDESQIDHSNIISSKRKRNAALEAIMTLEGTADQVTATTKPAGSKKRKVVEVDSEVENDETSDSEAEFIAYETAEEEQRRISENEMLQNRARVVELGLAESEPLPVMKKPPVKPPTRKLATTAKLDAPVAVKPKKMTKAEEERLRQARRAEKHRIQKERIQQRLLHGNDTGVSRTHRVDGRPRKKPSYESDSDDSKPLLTGRSKAGHGHVKPGGKIGRSANSSAYMHARPPQATGGVKVPPKKKKRTITEESRDKRHRDADRDTEKDSERRRSKERAEVGSKEGSRERKRDKHITTLYDLIDALDYENEEKKVNFKHKRALIEEVVQRRNAAEKEILRLRDNPTAEMLAPTWPKCPACNKPAKAAKFVYCSDACLHQHGFAREWSAFMQRMSEARTKALETEEELSAEEGSPGEGSIAEQTSGNDQTVNDEGMIKQEPVRAISEETTVDPVSESNIGTQLASAVQQDTETGPPNTTNTPEASATTETTQYTSTSTSTSMDTDSTTQASQEQLTSGDGNKPNDALANPIHAATAASASTAQSGPDNGTQTSLNAQSSPSGLPIALGAGHGSPNKFATNGRQFATGGAEGAQYNPHGSSGSADFATANGQFATRSSQREHVPNNAPINSNSALYAHQNVTSASSAQGMIEPNGANFIPGNKVPYRPVNEVASVPPAYYGAPVQPGGGWSSPAQMYGGHIRPMSAAYMGSPTAVPTATPTPYGMYQQHVQGSSQPLRGIPYAGQATPQTGMVYPQHSPTRPVQYMSQMKGHAAQPNPQQQTGIPVLPHAQSRMTTPSGSVVNGPSGGEMGNHHLHQRPQPQP